MPGLTQEMLENFDGQLALKRILNDAQTDFIYAPHLNAVYKYASKQLADVVMPKLRSGRYEPLLPITIEVPKASGASRPGSILRPQDRYVYQCVIDQVAPKAESILDRSRVSSYVLMGDDPDGFMFERPSECYKNYQDRLAYNCQLPDHKFVLQADVASHYQNINQHKLVNLLHSAGCSNELVSFLEKYLLLLTEKDSRGIIQGVYPSDFLGNFSLCSIDAMHDLRNVPSVRYVDDICMFFAEEDSARLHLIELCKDLRKEGLVLNEAKTRIIPVDSFFQEETEIEAMFNAAKEEIDSKIRRIDFYSTTVIWDEEPLTDEESETVEIDAAKALFDYVPSQPDKRDKIDKFCLPIFTALHDGHGIDYVLENFKKKPHQAQLYARYLAGMMNIDDRAMAGVAKLVCEEGVLFEYQKMWLLASVMPSQAAADTCIVDVAIRLLRDANQCEALRGCCALVVGKFGNPSQKKILKDFYSTETSDYVRAAILYSSKYFTLAEARTCAAAWGGHTELNALVVAAIQAHR